MISKKDLGETTENESVNESKKTIIENENLEKNNIFKDQIKNITQTKLKIETVEQPMKKKLIEPTNKEIKMTVYEGAVEKSKTKENINSFEELINLSSRKKDIELKYDLERNVNLIKFSSGKIDIAFNEKLNKNFVRNLSERLLEWTGNRWVISLTKESGQKSFLEQNAIKKAEVLERGKKQEIYKALKDAFPDAELIDVKEKNKL
jgi:DNA polymerase-3 subunit gamma/tau